MCYKLAHCPTHSNQHHRDAESATTLEAGRKGTIILKSGIVKVCRFAYLQLYAVCLRMCDVCV